MNEDKVTSSINLSELLASIDRLSDPDPDSCHLDEPFTTDLKAVEAGRTLLLFLRTFVCRNNQVDQLLAGLIDQAWGTENLDESAYRRLSHFARELAIDSDEAADILAARARKI